MKYKPYFNYMFQYMYLSIRNNACYEIVYFINVNYCHGLQKED